MVTLLILVRFCCVSNASLVLTTPLESPWLVLVFEASRENASSNVLCCQDFFGAMATVQFPHNCTAARNPESFVDMVKIVMLTFNKECRERYAIDRYWSLLNNFCIAVAAAVVCCVLSRCSCVEPNLQHA